MLRPLLTPVRVTRNLDAKPEVGQMQVETMCSVSQPGPNQDFEVPATLRKNPGSAHQVEERPLQHLRMNVKFYFQSSNETPIHQSGQSILQPLERSALVSLVYCRRICPRHVRKQSNRVLNLHRCMSEIFWKFFGLPAATQSLSHGVAQHLNKSRCRQNTSLPMGICKDCLTVWLSVQSL